MSIYLIEHANDALMRSGLGGLCQNTQLLNGRSHNGVHHTSRGSGQIDLRIGQIEDIVGLLTIQAQKEPLGLVESVELNRYTRSNSKRGPLVPL